MTTVAEPTVDVPVRTYNRDWPCSSEFLVWAQRPLDEDTSIYEREGLEEFRLAFARRGRQLEFAMRLLAQVFNLGRMVEKAAFPQDEYDGDIAPGAGVAVGVLVESFQMLSREAVKASLVTGLTDARFLDCVGGYPIGDEAAAAGGLYPWVER